MSKEFMWVSIGQWISIWYEYVSINIRFVWLAFVCKLVEHHEPGRKYYVTKIFINILIVAICSLLRIIIKIYFCILFKGHSHLCDHADLDTSFVNFEKRHRNPKSEVRVENI